MDQLPAPPLRVVVSSKCNLRCVYCSSHGENLFEVGNPLPLEVLTTAVRAAVDAGVREFRLTGGEPLLACDRIRAAAQAAYSASSDVVVHVTTNGTRLLAERAMLKSLPGMRLLKVSLDAVDRDTFERIAGRDCLREVQSGIAALCAEGFPLRINTVVSSINGKAVWDVLDWCASMRLPVKLFDVNGYTDPGHDVWRRLYVPLAGIRDRLREQSDSHRMVRAIANLGIPMEEFSWRGITVTVKDSTVGTTYGRPCRSCPLVWKQQAGCYCQEGFYNPVLTVDGLLALCRHRMDMAVSVADKGLARAHMASLVKQVLETYATAELRLHAGNCAYVPSQSASGVPQKPAGEADFAASGSPGAT